MRQDTTAMSFMEVCELAARYCSRDVVYAIADHWGRWPVGPAASMAAEAFETQARWWESHNAEIAGKLQLAADTINARREY